MGPLICIKFATQKPKYKKKKGTEACTKKLKETQADVLVFAGESKKEGVYGLGACTWSCQ